MTENRLRRTLVLQIDIAVPFFFFFFFFFFLFLSSGFWFESDTVLLVWFPGRDVQHAQSH